MVCFAVKNSECITPNGCGGGGIRNDELERIRKEAVLIYLRLYPHVFLVGQLW